MKWDIRERKGSGAVRRSSSMSMPAKRTCQRQWPPCSRVVRAARGEAGARRAWGSDSDPDESEEWEDYDEAYSEEYESDEEVRVRTPGVAACGFMVPASHQTPGLLRHLPPERSYTEFFSAEMYEGVMCYVCLIRVSAIGRGLCCVVTAC